MALCANLNVAQAALDRAQLREAANHNAAVVSIHGAAGWSVDEISRMFDVQARILEKQIAPKNV